MARVRGSHSFSAQWHIASRCRSVWGARLHFAFWFHVQGPNDGSCKWVIADARPTLAKAILLEGQTPPLQQLQQQDDSEADAAIDDNIATAKDGNEDDDEPQWIDKALRLGDLIDALAYRLLRNGVRLDEVSSRRAGR